MTVLPPRPRHATGKIYGQGRYLFIDEPYAGIHVIDNEDPAHPRPLRFVRIAGNVDLALKGRLLYADNGPDLVTIDVSNPAAPTLTRYGALTQLGYQAPLALGRVVLDVCAGLGWRESRRQGAAPVPGRYRSGPSDYGHQGWYFPAGFKLGVALGAK